MAEAGNLLINIIANTSGFTEKIRKTQEELKDLGKTAAVLGAALGGAFVYAIKQAAEQETATVGLTRALANQGVTSRAVVKDLQDYASAMQRATGVADDEITAAQALLVQYGLQGDELKRVTQLSLDLAAAKGIDLREAAIALGKAVDGDTQRLNALGIEVNENTEKQYRFAEAMKQGERLFGGSAAAQRDTFVGQLKVMKAEFDDIAKIVGNAVLPNAKEFVTAATKILRNLQETNPQLITTAAQVAAVGTAIVIAIGAISTALGYLTKTNIAIALITTAITLWIQNWAELKRSSEIVLNFLADTVNDVITMIVRKMASIFPVIGEVLQKIGLVVPGVGAIGDALVGMGRLAERVGKDEIKILGQVNFENAKVETTKRQEAQKTGDAKSAINQRELAELRRATEEKIRMELNHTNTIEIETRRRVVAAQMEWEQRATFSQLMRVQFAQDTSSWAMDFMEATTMIRDQFASGIADMILEGAKFSDVMSNIGKNILRFFIEEVVRKMVQAFVAGLFEMQAAQAGVQLTGGFLGGGAGVLPGGVPLAGAGSGAAAGGGLLAAGGLAALIGSGVAGKNIGSHLFGENSSSGGAGIGAGIGMALPGFALGGLGGGIIGGAANSVKTNIKNLGKKLKKRFSGGVIGEKSVIMGMESGAMALAGEDGPEALVSFRDDLGITPAQGRARLTGAMGGNGGGGGITINISGTFIEGDAAKWQRLIRESIVPELRRYTDVNPRSNFTRKRGQT